MTQTCKLVTKFARALSAMNFCNLIFHSSLRLLICMKHDHCVFVFVIEHHLRKIHKIKKKRLQAIFLKLQAHQIRDSRQINVLIIIDRILDLSMNSEYRCDACNANNVCISKHKRIVKKHLFKIQNIDHVKEKTNFSKIDVQKICVQFLCLSNEYRSFVVHFEVSNIAIKFLTFTLLIFRSKHQFFC